MTKTKKFILIGHQKRHGKDTFATMLQQFLPNSEILAFADPMRAILAEQNGMSPEDYKAYYNEHEEERDKMKLLGTGMMIKYFGDKVWRDVLVRQATQLDCEYIIVSDFRFKREYIPNSLTIKINNPRIRSDDSHISEVDLKDFDFDVNVINDGDLEQLEYVAYIVSRQVKFNQTQHGSTLVTSNY
jgi:hypothetical protein